MFASISVLVPTRKRPDNVDRLKASWRATVTGGAELLFRIDDDDVAGPSVVAPFRYVQGPRQHGYRSLPRFFEELRRVATGDLLMCGNDDMVFETPDWPQLVLAAANQYPDGIFDLGVETHNAKNFPFSIVSRRAVEAIGHLQDPRVFWGDVYLRDVMAHFSRAVRIPTVRVAHEWMGRTPDETFLDAKQGDRRNWDTAYWDLHRTAVADAVAKLRPLAHPGAA